MLTTVKYEIDITTENLLQCIIDFDDKQFNIVPFEGSWTAGQICEHLNKSASGVVSTMNGPVKDAMRPADEQVKSIEGLFMDFSRKFVANISITPSCTLHNKQLWLDSLVKVMAEIRVIADTYDLTKICTSVEVPLLGMLTRLEWIWLTIFHIKRHISQLQNILKALESETNNIK